MEASKAKGRAPGKDSAALTTTKANGNAAETQRQTRSNRTTGRKVTQRRKGPAGNAFARYEQLKAAWKAANAAATPEQYDAAMARIVRMAGV